MRYMAAPKIPCAGATALGLHRDEQQQQGQLQDLAGQ
jgi:hypothetical protein